MKRFIKFLNCTQGVNSDNPTEITRADIDNAIRTLINCACCSTYEEEYGGNPLRCKFYGFIMPGTLKFIIKTIDTFIPVSYYKDKTIVLHDEIGCIGNLRLIESYLYMPLHIEDMLSMNEKPIYNMIIIKESEKNNSEIMLLRYTFNNFSNKEFEQDK